MKRFLSVIPVATLILLTGVPFRLLAQRTGSAGSADGGSSDSSDSLSPPTVYRSSKPTAKDYIRQFNAGQKAIRNTIENGGHQILEQLQEESREREQSERDQNAQDQADRRREELQDARDAQEQQALQARSNIAASNPDPSPAAANYPSQADSQNVQQYSPPPPQPVRTEAPAPVLVEQYQPPERLADFNTSADSPSILTGKQATSNNSGFSEVTQNLQPITQPISEVPASGDTQDSASDLDSARASVLHGLQIVGDTARDLKQTIRGAAKEKYQDAKDFARDASSAVSQGLSDSLDNAQTKALPVDADHNIPNSTFIKGAVTPLQYQDQTISKPEDQLIQQPE